MTIVIKDNKYFNIVHQASIDTIENIVNNDCYSLLMEKQPLDKDLGWLELMNMSIANTQYFKDLYLAFKGKSETEANDISCENCAYNRLNDVDFHFINKCTKIDIYPHDMKIKGFSCSFFKDYRDEK